MRVGIPIAMTSETAPPLPLWKGRLLTLLFGIMVGAYVGLLQSPIRSFGDLIRRFIPHAMGLYPPHNRSIKRLTSFPCAEIEAAAPMVLLFSRRRWFGIA
jgi:hypothetical protein